MRRVILALLLLAAVGAAVAASGMFGVGRTMGPGDDVGTTPPGGGFALTTGNDDPLTTGNSDAIVTGNAP